MVRKIDKSNILSFTLKKDVVVQQQPTEIRFDQLATAIDSFCQKYEAYKNYLDCCPFALENERAEEDCRYYIESLFEQMKTVAKDTQDMIDLLESCERKMEKIQELTQDRQSKKEDLPYIQKDFI